MANELTVQGQSAVPALAHEMSVEMVLSQVSKIQDLMKAAMHEGEHFGVIPGTERKDKDGKDVSKKTLLKPGAEKLCLMFRFAPEYSHETTRENEHLTVISKCTLVHSPTGTVVATGSGMCSTYESKYAWRRADRKCPACGKEGTVIKGRPEYGGGWLCFGKKGGCGAKFADGSKEIEGQESGRKPNEDLADQWNTVVKMADKRALVAAVLNGTAASDIFTQDMEDLEENLKARGGTPEREVVDTSTSQVSGAAEVVTAGAQTTRQRVGRPKKDSPIETTATSALGASEGPSQGGFADRLDQKLNEQHIQQTAKAPVEPLDDNALISAADAEWVEREAKETKALLGAMLKQFGNHAAAKELKYGEFKRIKAILDKRRSMQGGQGQL